jgi:hypothetical protein
MARIAMSAFCWVASYREDSEPVEERQHGADRTEVPTPGLVEAERRQEDHGHEHRNYDAGMVPSPRHAAR